MTMMLGLVAVAVCAASLLGAVKTMVLSKTTLSEDKVVTLRALHTTLIFVQAYNTLGFGRARMNRCDFMVSIPD